MSDFIWSEALRFFNSLRADPRQPHDPAEKSLTGVRSLIASAGGPGGVCQFRDVAEDPVVPLVSAQPRKARAHLGAPDSFETASSVPAGASPPGGLISRPSRPRAWRVLVTAVLRFIVSLHWVPSTV